MNKENMLVGRTIQALKIADDKEALLFVTDEGEVIARCDADCCSHTWIEHIELPALGFPAKVLAVDDLEMPDLGDMEGRDVVSYYGCKISTDKGEIVIDYRNESNGYYGGWLYWPDDPCYGLEYYQANPTLNWVDVISDV